MRNIFDDGLLNNASGSAPNTRVPGVRRDGAWAKTNTHPRRDFAAKGGWYDSEGAQDISTRRLGT
jgi:hypothetical protein